MKYLAMYRPRAKRIQKLLLHITIQTRTLQVDKVYKHLKHQHQYANTYNKYKEDLAVLQETGHIEIKKQHIHIKEKFLERIENSDSRTRYDLVQKAGVI